MLRTYEGTLKGSRIDWSGEAPDAREQSLHVHITVLNEQDAGEDRGHRMAEALSRLADSGAFADIDDPSEWQREIRRDRSLPERKAE